MNKKILVPVILIAAVITYLLLRPGQESLDESHDAIAAKFQEERNKYSHEHDSGKAELKPQSNQEIKANIQENKKKIAEIEKDPKIPVYKKSLAKVSRILAAPFKEGVDHEGFIDLLKESKLEPIVRDRNDEDLGRIIHIRSKNSLPGTRYLQARFQNAPDGSTVAAYITFDYKPGEKSVAEAHEEVTKWLGIKGEPRIKKEGYRLNDAEDCHVVWTKKMNCDDLKNHQFNAYDCSSDKGLVTVMYESNPHCGTEDLHQKDAEEHVDIIAPDPEEE